MRLKIKKLVWYFLWGVGLGFTIWYLLSNWRRYKKLSG